MDPAVNCFLRLNYFHQLLHPLIGARDYFIFLLILVLDCLIIFHPLTFLSFLNLFLLLDLILTHHLFPLKLNLSLIC